MTTECDGTLRAKRECKGETWKQTWVPSTSGLYMVRRSSQVWWSPMRHDRNDDAHSKIHRETERKRERERKRLHFEFDAIILSTQCEAIEWQPHRVCVSASNGRTLFGTDRVANESCYGCNPFILYYSTAQQGKLCNDNVPSLFDLDNTRIENLNQCLISIRLKELIHR